MLARLRSAVEGSECGDTGVWLGAVSSGTGGARLLEQCRSERPSVMRAPLAVIVLFGCGAAWSQPLNEAVNGLEACFQQARIADSVCSKGDINAAQRQDCFKKARDAQLDCLDDVQQAMTAGSKPRQEPSAAASPKSPATIPSRAAPGTGPAVIGVASRSPTPTEQPDSAGPRLSAGARIRIGPLADNVAHRSAGHMPPTERTTDHSHGR